MAEHNLTQCSSSLRPSNIHWSIQKLSGELLAKFIDHGAAIKAIDACQSDPNAFPEWQEELRICRCEVRHEAIL